MAEKQKVTNKIVSLKITNFMSIKDAFLEFDDSNIISLCGYNDSGKSAVTRLFEVLFYNAYSNDQVKFIMDEQEYWSAVLTFSDGVVYTREKYADGRSFWELKKGDQVIYTNKLQNGTFAAIGDVPSIIANYLGVIQDELTGEELNVRRNTDKLFLINTSGGENYKILNTVLQSEVLANASKSLNEDKNKLNGEVSEKKTIKSVLSEQYDSYEVAPEEVLDEMKELIARLEENQLRLMKLTSIIENYEQMSSISVYDALDSVDNSRLADLQNIMELYTEKSEPVYDSVVAIDVERIKELQNIMTLKKSISVPSYDELQTVSVDRLQELAELGAVFNTYSGAMTTYNEVSNKLNTAKAELVRLSEQYNLKVCPNCGSIVA